MTFKLITGVIIAIIIQTIVVTTADESETESNGEADNVEKLTPAPERAEESIDNRTLNELEDASQNITSQAHKISNMTNEENNQSYEEERTLKNSVELKENTQDRISYHTKRGAPYSGRIPNHHNHHHNKNHHHHHHHSNRVRRRPQPHPKQRKKHRRGRRRPGFPGPIAPSGPPPSPPVISKPPYSKIPLKRNKPVLLSEVLRSGSHHPYAKFKPTGPSGLPIKEYIEEDEMDASPFSSIDAMESLPPTFSKFGRPPPSIEISDEVHDGLAPVSAIEDEIFFPGAAHSKPFPTMIKRPLGNTIYSMTKPPEIYLDDELESNIRNVRFAMKPPQNTYIDPDLINLLQKIKLDGNHLEPRPTESSGSSKDNVTDVNAAISKLLLPFLSESAVKKIQSYFKSLPSDKQHKEEDKNLTKVVYIVENHDREFNKNSNESAYKSYSIMQPMRDSENNTTYFIMLKSAESKNGTASSSAAHSSKSDTHRDTKKQHEPSTKPPEVKTTTLPSMQSLALQNYIMSLAGLTSHPRENQHHYLPRFNTFHKQPRNMY